MNPQTERRIVAFVNTIAKRCTTCFRRSEENCRNCLSLWANSIMTDIEAENFGHPDGIDRSLGNRTHQIIMQLTKANKPLLSQEIDTKSLCSFQLKLWTLKRLCKRGILGRRIAESTNGKKLYYYYIKNRQTKNQEQTDENRTVLNSQSNRQSW